MLSVVKCLLSLLQDPVEVFNSSDKQKQMSPPPATTDSDEFNSFQFWREPLPTIDDSLLELLVSFHHSDSSRTQTPVHCVSL